MSSLTVMTWNVENLIKPKPNATDQRLAAFEEKLSLLARVIRQLSPDVIGLQEVGGEDAVATLNAALNNVYPHHAVSEAPDGRGIRVAFLSKWEIVEAEDVVDFPAGPALKVLGTTASGATKEITRMGRGALRVRIRQADTPDGFVADVMCAHLKSKLLSFSKANGRTSFQPADETQRVQAAGIAVHRRTAEAVTVRSRINQLLINDPSTPFVLLGDFNDVPEAQTSLILNGPPGSEIGTRGFDRPDKGDNNRLFNLAPLIDESRRFSRVYRGKGELLDQIFASVEFFPLEGRRRRLPVVDSHVDFVARLPSIDDNPSDRDEAIAPDHAPVTATFDLG